MIELSVAPNISLYHVGPPLDLGPLPSFFYFSLSGPDSLSKDPYNQPVQFLLGKMIRIFSMTLPAHENGLPAANAIQVWADDFSKKTDPMESFFSDLDKALAFAIENQFVNPDKIAVGGLSRGGWIALHAAAREEKFKYALAFAPVTCLHKLKEFSHLQNDPLTRSWDLSKISPQLTRKQIKLYIGNRDTLVDTRSCFDFAMEVTEHAHSQSIRSPSIELSLHRAVGLHGHGTPPHVFRKGAEWIVSCLL